MEAGGFEPPSAQASIRTSHMLLQIFSTTGLVYPVFPGVRASFQPPAAHGGIARLSGLPTEFFDPHTAVSALRRFGVTLRIRQREQSKPEPRILPESLCQFCWQFECFGLFTWPTEALHGMSSDFSDYTSRPFAPNFSKNKTKWYAITPKSPSCD